MVFISYEAGIETVTIRNEATGGEERVRIGTPAVADSKIRLDEKRQPVPAFKVCHSEAA